MDIVTTVIGLILSGAMVIATIVLAWATRILSGETRRMREFQETPRLSIRLEKAANSSRIFELVLRNEGQGVAKNVRFGEFEGHPIPYSESVRSAIGCSNMLDLPLFKRGLKQWETGQTFTFLLGPAHDENFQIAAESPWTFHVEYESLSGIPFSEALEVDPSLAEGPFISTN